MIAVVFSILDVRNHSYAAVYNEEKTCRDYFLRNDYYYCREINLIEMTSLTNLLFVGK